MADVQQQLIEILQLAVEQAKPAGSTLAYHPVISEAPPGGSAFTTVHVITTDGQPVNRSFNFAAVAHALGAETKAKVEDRKIYGQQAPIPYKVITGAAGDWPFEIVFLQDGPV